MQIMLAVPAIESCGTGVDIYTRWSSEVPLHNPQCPPPLYSAHSTVPMRSVRSALAVVHDAMAPPADIYHLYAQAVHHITCVRAVRLFSQLSSSQQQLTGLPPVHHKHSGAHTHTHTTATAAAIIIARIPSAQCTPLSVTNANKRAPAAAGCGRAFRPRRCGTQVARGRKLAMYVCVRGVTATAGGA